MHFERDHLLQEGSFDPLTNGTAYREVPQYQSDHHLVTFYLLTRVYSGYLQRVLSDFHNGLKPDVVIINSCVWDISRYCSNWTDQYQENLQQLFTELRGVLSRGDLNHMEPHHASWTKDERWLPGPRGLLEVLSRPVPVLQPCSPVWTPD